MISQAVNCHSSGKGVPSSSSVWLLINLTLVSQPPISLINPSKEPHSSLPTLNWFGNPLVLGGCLVLLLVRSLTCSSSPRLKSCSWSLLASRSPALEYCSLGFHPDPQQGCSLMPVGTCEPWSGWACPPEWEPCLIWNSWHSLTSENTREPFERWFFDRGWGGSVRVGGRAIIGRRALATNNDQSGLLPQPPVDLSSESFIVNIIIRQKRSPLSSSVWLVCLAQRSFSPESLALPSSSPLHPLCSRSRPSFRCSDNCRQLRSWSAPCRVGLRVRWSCPSQFPSALQPTLPSPAAASWEHPAAELSASGCRCRTCKRSPVETIRDGVSGTGRPIRGKHQSRIVEM